MRTLTSCLLGLPALLLAAQANSAVTYSQRDARFFGDTTGRETTAAGSFTSATDTQLPVNFSTGGATPTLFDALATTLGTPFRLGASNHVDAGADTALTFNTDFVTPTSFVSLVQSGINDSNVVVTGGSGTGYLLPTFRVRGTFDDANAGAFGAASMCAGVDTCVPTNVATSLGQASFDTTFTPTIGTSTDFTFGTPFIFFFFVSAGITSFTTGNLTPGELRVDATLELVSISVVDANGDPIPGAVIHSDFLDELAVPEPGGLALLGVGLAVFACRRRAVRG